MAQSRRHLRSTIKKDFGELGVSVGFGTPSVGAYGGVSYSIPSLGTKTILNMKKGFFLVIIFLAIAVGLVFINVFIKSRKEYIKKYDFVISNIKTDVKGNITFYDSLNNSYYLASYRFNEWDKLEILIGDRVFKDSYLKNMTISRKVENEYKVIYTQKPNGMIPFSFYSY